MSENGDEDINLLIKLAAKVGDAKDKEVSILLLELQGMKFHLKDISQSRSRNLDLIKKIKKNS